MSEDHRLSRREVLLRGAAGGLAVAGLGELALPNAFAASERVQLKRGGNFRVGVGGGSDKEAIDAQNSVLDPDAARLVAMFEGLTYYDQNYKLQMGLAEEFSSPDAKIWTIRLRDGIQRAGAAAQAQITLLTCESSILGGRRAFVDLLMHDPAATAVITFNEQAIPGIMSAAADRGLRIPRDFSILAVDMPAQAALMTTPTMTTVGPTAAAMGRAAAGMLIERLEGLTTGVTQVLFDGELVLRESTGPVRA